MNSKLTKGKKFIYVIKNTYDETGRTANAEYCDSEEAALEKAKEIYDWYSDESLYDQIQNGRKKKSNVIVKVALVSLKSE